MAQSKVHVEAKTIGKRFGGVQALADVDVSITAGEIHGLVGENGAGKSTLGRIIAGVIRPDEGELRVKGREVSYRSPRDALADGITMIAQEPLLVPQRAVIENVLLRIEPHLGGVVRPGLLRKRYEEISDRAGFRLHPRARVSTLSFADQQKVAILQALARDAELIVMDEPTASLTRDEIERLFEIVRYLARAGTTIVYVSHFLEEILELADSVTVLKDGRMVRTSATAHEKPESLVTAMLGHSLDLTFPPKVPVPENAPTVLRAVGLTSAPAVDDVSLEVRAGEVVALAGLVGSGRSEVARAIFGALPLERGVVEIGGRPVRLRSPRNAIKAGIALLPEDRKTQGLLMRRPVFENVTLPHLRSVSRFGAVRQRAERRAVTRLTGELDVRMARLSAPVESLSGGNQQKVLFAKWLFRAPRVLILDEPTRGVDVGAKRAIYNLIASLAEQGIAVLLISSELEEVMGLAHRILVMRAGKVVAAFGGDTVAEDELMHAAFGTGVTRAA